MLETCVPEEYAIVMSGRAIIKDFILLGYTAPNGTDIYLLNGTTVGEQLMAGGIIGSNGTTNSSVPSGTPPTAVPPQQENGATGIREHIWGAMLLSFMAVVVL